MREPFTGRALALSAAVLLLVDTFLPWQSTSIEGSSYSWTAWHGDKGILVGVVAIVLIAWVAGRFAGVPVPAKLPVGATTLALAVLVFAFSVVKTIRQDDSAWASYLGVALAVAIVAGAGLAYRGEPASE
jgi:hypothetical protein